jgi:rRNA-processing protein FCF1
MNPMEEEIAYEEKMDEITAQLEELILDAVIAALEKIRKRNQHFEQVLYRSKLII